MANSKTAGAVPKAGSAKVSSFRYYNSLCFVTLSNGVHGIVGSASDFPFATMLSLKGSGATMHYRQLADKDGYERYALEWEL